MVNFIQLIYRNDSRYASSYIALWHLGPKLCRFELNRFQDVGREPRASPLSSSRIHSREALRRQLLWGSVWDCFTIVSTSSTWCVKDRFAQHHWSVEEGTKNSSTFFVGQSCSSGPSKSWTFRLSISSSLVHLFCWPGDRMSLGHWNLDVGGLVKQLQLKDATHRDAFFPMISARAATSQGLKHDCHIWFILIPFVSFWLNLERKLRTYEISYFFWCCSCKLTQCPAESLRKQLHSTTRGSYLKWGDIERYSGECQRYPKIYFQNMPSESDLLCSYILQAWSRPGQYLKGTVFLSWRITEIPCSYQFVSGTVCNQH